MSMKFNKISPIQKCSWIEKYSKNSKTVRDLQNSLPVHKMFADSKDDHAFQKMFVKSKKMFVNFTNCSNNFQKNVRRF
jgi:hypothetical protein